MKRLGNDLRLMIESTTAGTYNEIKGQQNLSVNRSAQTIDTTTKDEFPYGSSAAGSRSLSLPFTLIPDLPDVTGYERLVTLSSSSAPFNVQIIDTANSDEVVFECAVGLSDRNNQLDLNAAGAASGTLVNRAPPTIDLL